MNPISSAVNAAAGAVGSHAGQRLARTYFDPETGEPVVLTLPELRRQVRQDKANLIRLRDRKRGWGGEILVVVIFFTAGFVFGRS